MGGGVPFKMGFRFRGFSVYLGFGVYRAPAPEQSQLKESGVAFF